MENNTDLINKIENIKNRSEERILILDEKMNDLNNELNRLIDNYKIDLYKDKIENNDDIDIFSLQQIIIDYVNNERENSIDNLNDIFNKIIENINQKNINLKENENIKKLINIIKNELIKQLKEIQNKKDDLELQKNEIDNKIKTQIFEQFEIVNNRIMNELLVGNKEKDLIINNTQEFLLEIKNQMKTEKLQR